MDKFLGTIAFFLLIGTAGASDLGTMSLVNMLINVLISLACIALALYCHKKKGAIYK